jgi:excisionase family DNA binding protein
MGEGHGAAARLVARELSTCLRILWTAYDVNDVTGVTLTAVAPRFLALADVAEILNVSSSQVYALVRSGALEAIRIGGRGQWRVETSQLEAYIQRCYSETKDYVEAHPFGGENEPDEPDAPSG